MDPWKKLVDICNGEYDVLREVWGGIMVVGGYYNNYTEILYEIHNYMKIIFNMKNYLVLVEEGPQC